MTSARGTLYLVPNTLDLGVAGPPPPIGDVLPGAVIEVAARLRHWRVENARSARAFLKRVDAVRPLEAPLQSLSIVELPRPRKGGDKGSACRSGGGRSDFARNGAGRSVAGRSDVGQSLASRSVVGQGSAGRSGPAGSDAGRSRIDRFGAASCAGGEADALSAEEAALLLAPATAGFDLGLLSEAGLPAVADPGASLVAAAHAAGVPVVALPGPSSLLLALAASGLPGQHFAFVGYLPIDAGERAGRIRQLEADSRHRQQTQLMIETPYRNGALLAALVDHLQPETQLSVSCGLTLAGACTWRMNVARWRSEHVTLPGDVPAVFAFFAA